MNSRRLLVVGWDSADWKIIRPLISRGEMPMMQRIVQNGVHGDLRTLEPSLSPMLWTTIATGRHAAEHGVHGFTESRDGQVVPVSACTRRCKAIWNILSDRGLKTNLVGWFASQGEQDPNVQLVSNLYPHAPRNPVSTLSDWPKPAPGTFWPERLSNALSNLRLGPHELGSDVLRMFVKDIHAIDQQKDRRLFLLAQKLAETFSIQAAATWLMEHESWDLTMVYFRAIDEISHVFMPFHPPRMLGAPEKEFDHYNDVVNSTYRLHDLMLTRLVDLAGPEAGVLVISDHGFHSDHLRPRFVPNIPAGIVAWHRPFGIIAGSGQGFPTHGQSIFGAGLQDVAPTILQWFGIPRAKDMMGRVLTDALLNPNKLEEVETYENRDAPEPNASCFELKDHDRRAMLEHFVDLGYIEELPSDAQAACEQTTNENRWQLACSLLHSGRYEEALPLLEQAHDANPMRPDIAQRLAHCQLHFGLTEDATVTIESSIAGFQDANAVSMIRAQIANQKGDYSQAIQLLDEVRLQMPNYPGLREQLASTYLRLRRWDLAETLAKEIIESDPNNAPAWAILSRCQLHGNDNTGCIDSALEAIHLNFSSPMAHINLGIALARTHKYSKAVTAFRNAIKLAPANIPPYRFLSHVYSRMGMHEESIQWMNQARQMRQEFDKESAKTIQRVKQSAQERSIQRASRPRKPAAKQLEPLDLLVVSGLPRSGTSLMMQILQAGGVPLLTDGIRTADEDNPEGYWEWEAIKGIVRNPEILSQAQGKAVKVISALLGSLPRIHTYKILYMVRPIEEIIASQYKMLERKGITSKYDLKEIATLQQQHSLGVRESLKRFDQVKLLEVSYRELISCPDRTLSSIGEFLGDVFRLGPNVYECIKPSLYRQRN